MKTDLQKSFRKLVDAFFTNYQGCIIERHQGKYKALGKWYDSMEEAKFAIDNSYNPYAKKIESDACVGNAVSPFDTSLLNNNQ